MNRGFIFIIVLWSFSSYGGGLSSLGNMVKRICSVGFSGNKSRAVNVEETRKAKEISYPFLVLVVRHASYSGTPDVKGGITREQAETYGLSDIRLRLSKEGKERFMKMCRAKKFCAFDLLIHSKAMRAWETANIFSDYFTVKERRMSDNLSERLFSEPEDILQEIRDSNVNTVVLVGHQPSLREFVSKALGKDDSTVARILLNGYGNMIPLKFSSWDFGSAKLEF